MHARLRTTEIGGEWLRRLSAYFVEKLDVEMNLVH